MLKRNYHTHTFRCKHATGDVDEYCRAAIGHGMDVLGFSDHTPLPDNRWHSVRMDVSELPAYSAAIDNARKKYPQLVVLKAMECEYAPEYVDFYQERLIEGIGCDYLIAAAHWYPHEKRWASIHGDATTPAMLRSYARYVIASMESGLFAFMAHPDVFGCNYLRWDADTEACSRDILEAAKAIRMPLEINGYGLIKKTIDTPDGSRHMYPWEPFWQLAAEYDIEVVVNSDAHAPRNIAADMPGAAAIAERYGLRHADLSHLHEKALARE
ncbi:MAG: histidinol-phosphatase [bacterium]|nr:histidinol-phosphatase [bacterium]